MRLLTHNLLACHSKACVSTSLNFPLSFNQVQLELIQADFNPDFIINFLPKIHWPALVEASRQVSNFTLIQTWRSILATDERWKGKERQPSR